MKKIIALGEKIESLFTWLNSEDKNDKDKYAKIAVAGAMLLTPILLGSLIDFS